MEVMSSSMELVVLESFTPARKVSKCTPKWGRVGVDDRVADLMKMKEENDAIILGRGGGRSLFI